MAGLVQVVVSDLQGETLDFQLEPGTSVLELKEKIAGERSIPEVFQTLVTASAGALDDDDAHIGPGRYTLLISLVKVNEALSSGSSHRRVEALGELRDLGPRGGAAAMLAVCRHLEDEDRRVRRAAAKALGRVAEAGDQHAIAVARRLLEDRGWSVRAAAVEALAAVAEKGDQLVTAAVRTLLDDESWRVRAACVTALGRVAEAGDQDAIAAASNLLVDENADVRHAAAEAIARVADTSDVDTIAAARSVLGSWM